MKRPESAQPRKQRKWLAKAPLHKRQKMVASPLNKELKTKYGRNAIPVRKGDTVEVMRGSSKGVKGEVLRVDLSDYTVYVQGVTSKKADGTQVERPLDASNIMITEIYEEDKERREALTRTTSEEK